MLEASHCFSNLFFTITIWDLVATADEPKIDVDVLNTVLVMAPSKMFRFPSMFPNRFKITEGSLVKSVRNYPFTDIPLEAVTLPLRDLPIKFL